MVIFDSGFCKVTPRFNELTEFNTVQDKRILLIVNTTIPNTAPLIKVFESCLRCAYNNIVYCTFNSKTM